MAIFWNIFIKTFSFFLSFAIIIFLVALLIGFFNNNKTNNFSLLKGEENSTNTVVVFELDGLIINSKDQFSEFISPFLISPNRVKRQLEELSLLSPKTIIFSINSPGGTVSASKNLYEILKKFKENNETEIIFHTNELLASGGYWMAASGDRIFGNYGSIIGSIGVKGPEWYFYDEPLTMSSGIFGNKIETKNGIKVYSNIAGKSKDLFNPFRLPSNKELSFLESMVDEIYFDFINIVSKERKIEIETLKNEIGALIYTAGIAKELHLIDGVISLDGLIDKILNEKKYKDYKVIKKYNNKNSILRKIINGTLNNGRQSLYKECLSLRSSISAVLSYQSIGC